MQQRSVIKTAYSWSERIFLLLLGLCLIFQTLKMTTFFIHSLLPDGTEFFLLYTLLAAVVFKTVFLILSQAPKRRTWTWLLLCALLVSLIWLLVYWNDRFLFLAFLAVLTVGCLGTDYHLLLKVQVCAVGAIVVSAAIAASVGAVTNFVYWYSSGHDSVRSSMGIGYVTDMASFYLFLCIAAWIAWDQVSDLFFLLPALLTLWISSVVADSTTGFLFSILLILCILWVYLLKRRKDSRLLTGIQKAVDCCCVAAFPFFALLMIFLTWAYRQGFPFALRLDEWNHYRLSLAAAAWDNYGIHLFGFPFPLNGAGFSTAPNPDYNYVDCSYMQMLLRYGVFSLAMFMVLWPLMTHTAVRSKKTRLSLGLALIAFHSVSEQRFLDIDYNLFLAAPFAVFSIPLLRAVPKKARRRKKKSAPVGKRRIAAAVVSLLVLTLLFLYWKPLLSGIRTVRTLIWVWEEPILVYQRAFALLSILFSLVAALVSVSLMYRIVLDILCRRRPKALHFAVLLFFSLIAALVLVRGNHRLDVGMEEKRSLVEEDAAVVRLAQAADGMKLYVTDIPTLYERQYGGISVSIFNGEDLARLENVIIIASPDYNAEVFFSQGFSRTVISDFHLVYTDSPAFREALFSAGYGSASRIPASAEQERSLS